MLKPGRMCGLNGQHQWIFVKNAADDGFVIETPHYGLGVQVTERLVAKRLCTAGSFRFIPVPNAADFYLCVILPALCAIHRGLTPSDAVSALGWKATRPMW
jgi:hypothetical protein